MSVTFEPAPKLRGVAMPSHGVVLARTASGGEVPAKQLTREERGKAISEGRIVKGSR